MKHTILALGISLFLAAGPTACDKSKHSEAVNQAKQIQAAVQDNVPGSIPTSKDGYMYPSLDVGIDPGTLSCTAA